MSGDLAEVVDGHAGVGHPGQAGVAQAVAAEVLVTERSDDLIPVGRVAKDSGGYSATSRACEQSCVLAAVDGFDATRDQWPDLFDQGDDPSGFGALVDQTARRRRRLATYGPSPRRGIDVGDAAAGHFPDGVLL